LYFSIAPSIAMTRGVVDFPGSSIESMPAERSLETGQHGVVEKEHHPTTHASLSVPNTPLAIMRCSSDVVDVLS
jgi:hypothetical protein